MRSPARRGAGCQRGQSRAPQTTGRDPGVARAHDGAARDRDPPRRGRSERRRTHAAGLEARHLANQVFVARDGAEALDFFFGDDAHAPDHVAMTPKIVLLDLDPPKVDGLEVLRRLKADARTRALPVVVLTSSREEPDVAAYRLGANSYIVKPVDFEAFARAVSDVGLYWVLVNAPPG